MRLKGVSFYHHCIKAATLTSIPSARHGQGRRLGVALVFVVVLVFVVLLLRVAPVVQLPWHHNDTASRGSGGSSGLLHLEKGTLRLDPLIGNLTHLR